ncbi:hypothetical protein G9A89_016838 [Geosiphon pyriformis]|nr:hypothetical protein G9A89_016838 [Geosiphon pyriformis]
MGIKTSRASSLCQSFQNALFRLLSAQLVMVKIIYSLQKVENIRPVSIIKSSLMDLDHPAIPKHTTTTTAPLNGRAKFEFEVMNSSREYFSQTFSSAPNMFWQLTWAQDNMDDSGEWGVFLHAVRNQEEMDSAGVWSERSNLQIVLYVTEISSNAKILEETLDHVEYSVGQTGWGRQLRILSNSNNFISYLFLSATGFTLSLANIPKQVCVGVIFGQISAHGGKITPPLPRPLIPRDLITAWAESLGHEHCSDVRFSVRDQYIYSNSIILSQRSEYFRRLFEGNWRETTLSLSAIVRKPKPLSPHKALVHPNSMSDSTTNVHIKYPIEVPDFEYETFFAMLHFLYTNEIRFGQEDSETSALKILAVSDKYLIHELRNRAKNRITSELNCENVSKLFFSEAWKWPDLKKVVFEYIIDNFEVVRRSDGFKRMRSECKDHMMANELLFELLEKVKV